MLTREKCREIAAKAVDRYDAADALFAAFESERSTWIASIDVGDERREFESRVHAMACAVAPFALKTGSDIYDHEAVADIAVDYVLAVDAALAKERAT